MKAIITLITLLIAMIQLSASNTIEVKAQISQIDCSSGSSLIYMDILIKRAENISHDVYLEHQNYRFDFNASSLIEGSIFIVSEGDLLSGSNVTPDGTTYTFGQHHLTGTNSNIISYNIEYEGGAKGLAVEDEWIHVGTIGATLTSNECFTSDILTSASFPPTTFVYKESASPSAAYIFDQEPITHNLITCLQSNCQLCSENLILVQDQNNFIASEILEHQVSDFIDATNIIGPQADITYSVTNYGTLKDGFEVELAAEFELKIEGCELVSTDDPNPPALTFTTNNGLETYPSTDEVGKFTAEQIVYATGLQKQGPYNPGRAAPWGLHDAPIYLPQGWDFSQGAKSNSGYQTFFRPAMEWRGAVFTENNQAPPSNVIVQVRNPQYYAFVNGSWVKQFDVDLKPGSSGAYLAGNPVGTDPFTGGTHFGSINWQNIGNNTYQAPFVGPQAMHFWRGNRHPIQDGQTAELAVAEMRIVGPNGSVPDRSKKLLAQIGIDYYEFGENNTRAPGPGIGRYQELTEEWLKLAWLTTPQGTPITFDANVDWLNNNPPPVLAN